MSKKLLIAIMIAAWALLATSCSESNVNTNANSNAGDTASTTAPPTTAPNNSDVTTTDKNGVKTETRMIKDNPKVSKVVVTTRNGKRTVKVYSPSGEEKDVTKNEPAPDALHATGDAIADAAGWTKDKTETAYDKTKEGAKTVADKTADTSKTVANKTKHGAKKAGDKTVDTTKKVVDKTVEGAKKTGNAIKKVVVP